MYITCIISSHQSISDLEYEIQDYLPQINKLGMLVSNHLFYTSDNDFWWLYGNI